MTDEGSSLLVHLRRLLRSDQGIKTVEGGMQGAVISEAASVPLDMCAIDTTEVGGKHGLSFRFRRYMETMKKSETWEQIKQRTVCSGCRQPPSQPQVTSCFHIYCLACLNDLQHLAARRGYDSAPCSECGTAYTSVQPCEDYNELVADESPRASSTDNTQPRRTKKEGHATDSWIDMSGEVLPSAKTQAAKAQVCRAWV